MTLDDFRLLRDAYQRERRAATIGSLYEQWDALTKEIAPLEAKRAAVDKHHKTAVEFELKPLWFKRQDVQAEISAIEREMFVPYALGFVVRGGE